MSVKGSFLPLARAITTDTSSSSNENIRVQDLNSSPSPVHDAQTPFYNRFKFRLDDIDSLSTFVNHLDSFPDQCFQEYGAFDETLRKLFANTKSSFVGRGLSFAVGITSGRQLDPAVTDRFPEKSLQRHRVIATKVPRLENEAEENHDLAGLKAYALRAVALESLCLFHPPIQSSKYVVDLLGLVWTPVQNVEGAWLIVPALVMEYAEEGTLDDLLQCGPYVVPLDLKMELALDIALGLEALHECGLVHADLKATNVLLFRNQNRILLAKISDFGCAQRDFGSSDTLTLPPYWPRWDAPEGRIPPRLDEPGGRPRRAAIKVEKAPKVDVYCFGLLVWQLMLDGKTPFDRGREPWPACNIGAFKSIIHAVEKEEEETAISALKDRSDDEFMRLVLLTCHKMCLSQVEIHNMLSYTLCRSSDDRYPMKNIIDHCFCNYIIKRPEGDSRKGQTSTNEPENLSYHSFPSQSLASEMDAAVQSYTPDTISRMMWGVVPPAEYLDVHYEQKVRPGNYIQNVIKFDKRGLEGQLPFEVKQCMCDEYREDGLDAPITKGIPGVRKAFLALQYSLCKLVGFGCDPEPLEGLSWLCKAAVSGSGQAQALVYRLHKSHGVPVPIASRTLAHWLISAIIRGSLNAYKDLSEINVDIANSARKRYIDINWGEGEQISMNLESMLITYPLRDKRGLAGNKSTSRQDYSAIGSKVDHPVDTSGQTLLHYACAIGDAPLVSALISFGADVNKTTVSGYGLTPLGLACRCGHAAIAIELMENNADASIANFFGAIPLHYLVYMDEEFVEELANMMTIKSKSLVHSSCWPTRPTQNYICERSDTSGTPLHWAVRHGQIKVVDALLKLGADPLQDETRYSWPIKPRQGGFVPCTSPLHSAAALHRLEILELMIKHIGPDKVPASAIDAAIKTSRIEMMCLNGEVYKERFLRIIELLCNDMCQKELMAMAILHGQQLVVEHLIKSGYALDSAGIVAGMTALQQSLHLPDGSISLYLLGQGADATCLPSRPCCPLSTLALRPDGTHLHELTSKLIQGGNTYGKEPQSHELLYRRTIIEGWVETANLLIQHGMPYDRPDRELLVSLLKQNSQESLRGLRYLIEHSSHAIAQYPIVEKITAWTPLHLVVTVEEFIRDDELNTKVLALLLEKFASEDILNAVDLKRRTAIFLAVLVGNHGAVKKLLDAGADHSTGNLSIYKAMLERLVFPDELAALDALDGDVGTASSRGRKRRRFEENSINLLIVLLHGQHQSLEPFVRQSYARWRSIDFQLEVISAGIAKELGFPSVELSVGYVDRQGRNQPVFCLFDAQTGATRPVNSTEIEIARTALWKGITEDCRIAE